MKLISSVVAIRGRLVIEEIRYKSTENAKNLGHDSV